MRVCVGQPVLGRDADALGRARQDVSAWAGTQFTCFTSTKVQILKPEGQGNNAYIFPGLGLGALAAKATKLDESCLLVAASALAAEVDAESLAMGR